VAPCTDLRRISDYDDVQAFLDVDEADIDQLLKEDVQKLIKDALGAGFAPMLGPLLHERNWSLAKTVHM